MNCIRKAVPALEGAVLLVVCCLGTAFAATTRVSNGDAFRKAVAAAKPGDRILLEPGTYQGVFYFERIKGAPAHPIIIGAADPKRPPIIRGGTEAIHLTSVAHLELRDLVIDGAKVNGLNADDGGSYQNRTHHLTLRNLLVRSTGPSGGGNGIKLSGVDESIVVNCTVEGWPQNGCAIDMVGCHRVQILGCTFRNSSGVGIQAKGGSEDIRIRKCLFDGSGERAVNAGGSTGMSFFRPKPQWFEARNIIVEGCVFIGWRTPIAFVGIDGGVFRYNTVYRPKRWALRILQETVAPGFVPSRNGVYSDNIVVFRSDEMVDAVNIGPNTAPSTFRFARNLWYCIDSPGRSKPSLPTAEKDGIYGKDPLLKDPSRGDFGVRQGSPAAKIGAHALPNGQK